MNPNKALWEKGDFTRIAQSMRESGEALVNSLGISKGLKVLDLGCGDGTTALPEARLGADVLGVDIAQNLVENAVKYNTPGGRIRVEARAVDGDVEVTIGNTGDGIPNERAGLLFERFYRVCGGERVPGHGLGLSIARELARAHGGDVELVRSDGSWTEMRLRLLHVA